MGYYTTYSLTVLGSDNMCVDEDVEHQIMKEIYSKIYGDSVNILGEDLFFENLTYESLKWYRYSDDMAEVSRHYPNYTFIMLGQGESGTDYWIHYLRNGEQEYTQGRLTFDSPQKSFAQKVEDIALDWAEGELE